MNADRLCVIALYCLLLPSLDPSSAAASLIEFDTRGGETWTYSKNLTGRIEQGACDEVIVSGPRGQVRAEILGERFATVVALHAGPNPLVASCRKADRERARTELQEWEVKLPDTPQARIRMRRVGEEIELDGRGSQPAPGTPAPIVEYAWHGATLVQPPKSRDSIRIRPPEADGEYTVQLEVKDARGRTDVAGAFFRVLDGETILLDGLRHRAQWIDSAVLYGIVPFFFGGFDGIRERLDEIAALGATAIWLSPLTATTADDFGYGPIDHFRMRDTFGTEAAFHALVRTAHALGLKVIVDFVPNHISDRHRYSLDAQRFGRRSAYYDWFDRDHDGDITHYFDWSHLNNLNFDNPDVRRFTVAAFAHWLREYDVDGFRADAAWGITQRAPEFWPQWRAELKRIRPDMLLLAEASPQDAIGFDAAYDWTAQVGEWAWRDVFHDAKTVPDLDRLRRALSAEPGQPPRLRFINNNDTGARFITRYGVQYAKLAALLTFTVPGIPLIFNGDEVGAAFEPYEEGPPLEWHDTHELTAWYQRLTRLRQALPALRTDRLQVLATSQDERVLAFARPMNDCESEVLAVINFSAARAAVSVRWQSDARLWRDALSGKVQQSAGRAMRLQLDGYEAVVLRPERCEIAQ